MKIIGALLIAFSILFGIGFAIAGWYAGYSYRSNIESYWILADRASTINDKIPYMDKFVDALDISGLQGSNDSLFFPTLESSFDGNMATLKSLQSRLHDLQGQDQNTMQYQTAMQQITGQEMNQAGEMLGRLEGCWWKVNHPMFWNPFFCLGVILSIIGMLVVGIWMIFSDF